MFLIIDCPYFTRAINDKKHCILCIQASTVIRRRGRGPRIFRTLVKVFGCTIYNPGKKLVDFLNFQNLSPSPHIQCWYLGYMCCKSTLPEPTLFVGRVGEGYKVNTVVALIEKCSHFHHMFSNLSVYFEKSTHIFSKIV